MFDTREGSTNPYSYSGQSPIGINKIVVRRAHKKLDVCTSDCFIAPIVITVKKDDFIKLATKSVRNEQGSTGTETFEPHNFQN